MGLQGLVVWRMWGSLFPATKHRPKQQNFCLCAHSAQLCSEGGALGGKTKSVTYPFTNPGNGSLLGFETFCNRHVLMKKKEKKRLKLLLPDPDVEQLGRAPSLTAPSSQERPRFVNSAWQTLSKLRLLECILIFILLTLIHMVLGALARMLAWCHERYSSTRARFCMSDGYQWSGVLYFRLRYSRMAVLLQQ